MLDSRKYSIIEWIISVADEHVIDTIQSIKEKVESEENTDLNDNRYSYISSSYKDIQARKVDLEKLKKEQNYKSTSEEELAMIAEEAKIEQSIEDLLADLKEMG